MSREPTEQPPLRLDSLGLNERMQKRFEIVFSGAGGGIATFVNTTVAEAIIVDLDNPGGRRDWPRYRERFPHRPAILLSLTQLRPEGVDHVLSKPIDISELLRAVIALRKHLDTKADRTASVAIETLTIPDKTEPRTIIMDSQAVEPEVFRTSTTTVSVEPAPPSQALEATVAITPDGELDELDELPAVEPEPGPPAESRTAPTARRHSDAPHRSTPPDKLDITRCALSTVVRWRETLHSRTTPALLRKDSLWLLYEPYSGKVVSSKSRNELVEFCQGPCLGLKMEEGDAPVDLAEQAVNNPDQVGATWTDPDAMLWDLALWTYGDRIPADTDFNQRLYLAHWPNLTRLTLTPNALRIAALLADQSLSLSSVTEALRIPVEDVSRFYAACHTIGIAGPAKRTSDNLFRTSPVPVAGERPLFGRLVSKLRGFLHTGDDSATTARTRQ